MNTDLPTSAFNQQEITSRFKKMTDEHPPLEKLNKQFDSLQTLITDWLDRSPAKASGDNEELVNLAQRITILLRDFKDFFSDYQTYFKRRILAGDIPADRAAYVLREVNHQTQEQWATLSRLLAQRRYGSPYDDRLLKADKQAAVYYERFGGFKPQPRETQPAQPLVYFEKLYNITRFPYQTVPLIAIPLTDWDRQEDWLPLAHEMGHYVFWNSADLELYQEVQKCFQDAIESKTKEFFSQTSGHTQAVIDNAIQTWQRWLEESFADIFGTLVAGPDYAQNAQNRQVSDVLSQADDLLQGYYFGQHPIPAVRPLLSAEALKYLDGGQATGEGLTRRWAPYLERAETIFNRQVTDVPAHPSPTLLAKMVPAIVEAILTTPTLQACSGSLEVKPLRDLMDLTWPAEKWAEFAPDKLPDPVFLPEGDVLSEGVPQLTTEPDEIYNSKSFRQLRRFMQTEIQQPNQHKPEWKAILDLEFSQFSKNWEFHPHIPLSHKKPEPYDSQQVKNAYHKAGEYSHKHKRDEHGDSVIIQIP